MCRSRSPMDDGRAIDWQAGRASCSEQSHARPCADFQPTPGRPALVAGGLPHDHGSQGREEIFGAEGLLQDDRGLL